MKPTLFTRLRWRLEDWRHTQDAKIVAGLVGLAVLVAGGFLLGRSVGRASALGPPSDARIVTVRHRERVRVHGRIVTRWRVRKLLARTRTVHTPNGTRVVTQPVTNTQVSYRKRLVTVHGKTRTTLQPVTNTRTLTGTSTQLLTVTRQLTNTDVVTVTRPVTVTETTTVVSTVTETLPITVTDTIP